MEKKIAFAFLYILVFPAFIILLSGDFTWPEGWIFCIWFILLCFSTILYLKQKDPALLAERYQKPGAGIQESVMTSHFPLTSPLEENINYMPLGCRYNTRTVRNCWNTV